MTFRKQPWFSAGWGVAFLFGVAAVGCHRNVPPTSERIPPHPNAPALYGPPTGIASKEIARAKVPDAVGREWQSAPFYVQQTELSPAMLVHGASARLDLFAGLANDGLGGPAFVAWATMNGPRSFRRGEPLDVSKMEEGWVLVWWAGAEGWTNWDSPWVVYLQHKPDAMKLDDDGLHLEFPREAGDVVLMPLYGYDKLPQPGHDFGAEHGLPAPKIQNKTWEWPKGLTRDPLTRIRYWASATRELPTYCEDSFRVDRAQDTVTIRSRFQWRSIDDDWKTRHVKLAPLSPPLAHAIKEGGFPVELSKRWFDLELSTPSGPYLAVEGADQFDATFFVLHYLNETEAFDSPATNAQPSVRSALDRLRAMAAQQFGSPARGGTVNAADSVGAIRADGWLAKAWPYLDETTRSHATAVLRPRFRDRLDRLASTPAASNDTSETSMILLESLWAYAHFTGDWGLVKERWPAIEPLFTAPARTRWSGFGCDGVAENGTAAAACVAFARLAYQAGDMDSYHYACQQFARELTLLFLKQRGADYFRQHQPRHSMEFMDDEVFLTRLSPDGAGWTIDGPKYPAAARTRLFDERWVGFNDPDVSRFYRDYLKGDVRRELNWLQHRGPPERRGQTDPRGRPSLVQLRSLLLNETPDELAATAAPEQFSGPPSGVIASCWSVLRATSPTRYDRLIPPGASSPFVAGLEREMHGPNPNLITAIEHEALDAKTGRTTPIWPRLTWPHWKTPAAAGAVLRGDPATEVGWSFGQIRPAQTGLPGAPRVIPLNWNTRVIVCDFAEGRPPPSSSTK
jgi:hypothetical protein